MKNLLICMTLLAACIVARAELPITAQLEGDALLIKTELGTTELNPRFTADIDCGDWCTRAEWTEYKDRMNMTPNYKYIDPYGSEWDSFDAYVNHLIAVDECEALGGSHDYCVDIDA